jgi:hypothetical protein
MKKIITLLLVLFNLVCFSQQFFKQEEIINYSDTCKYKDTNCYCKDKYKYISDRYLYLSPIGKLNKVVDETSINDASANIFFQMNLIRPKQYYKIKIDLRKDDISYIDFNNPNLREIDLRKIDTSKKTMKKNAFTKIFHNIKIPSNNLKKCIFAMPLVLKFNATSFAFNNIDSTFNSFIFPDNKQSFSASIRPGWIKRRVQYNCFPIDFSVGSVSVAADSNSTYYRIKNVKLDIASFLVGYQYNKYFEIGNEKPLDIGIFSVSIYYTYNAVVPKFINKSSIKNDYYSITALNNEGPKAQMNFSSIGSRLQFQYKSVALYSEYRYTFVQNTYKFGDNIATHSIRFGLELNGDLFRYKIK